MEDAGVEGVDAKKQYPNAKTVALVTLALCLACFLVVLAKISILSSLVCVTDQSLGSDDRCYSHPRYHR